MTEIPEFVVVVVEHSAEFIMVCKECRKFYAQGPFAVMVQLSYPNGTQKSLFLGPEQPVICCGTQKKGIRVFTDRNEALGIAQEVALKMTESGSADGIPLLDWVIPSAN